MKLTARGLGGRFLAAIGVLVVLGEVALHFASWYFEKAYEMNHGVLLVGAVVGFVGFYMLDPKAAEGGAGFLVGAGERIAKALPRFGRRASDAIAVPNVETLTTAIPVPAPLPRDEADGIEPTP